MVIEAIRAEPARVPPLQFDLDHAEQIMRMVSAIAIDPFKNTLYYFFPFIGAFSSNYIEMRQNDPAQEAMMPTAVKQAIIREVRDLTAAAGLRREVIPYTALNHTFSNCGGSLSFTRPALFMPHQHLFRSGKSPFTQERDEDNLQADLWHYTDDETRFLISRELGQIRENGQLLRIAMKVALAASIFILYTMPFAWFAGLLILAGAAAIHLISERAIQAKMDAIGTEILSRRLNNDARAREVALSALDKMQRQNLARREHSKLCRLYITKSGNNLLDLNHPFLTSRINKIRNAALPN